MPMYGVAGVSTPLMYIITVSLCTVSVCAASVSPTPFWITVLPAFA